MSATARTSAPASGALALRDGEIAYCLTDRAANALEREGIVLDAVAPATVRTRDGHACVQMPLREGYVRLDLTGVVAAQGGFSLRRTGDGRSADFEDITGTIGLDGAGVVSAGVVSARRHGADTRVLTFTNAGMALFLTELRGRDMPLTLTEACADSLARDFGTSPLPAGEDLAIASGTFRLLPALTGNRASAPGRLPLRCDGPNGLSRQALA
ncbi:hypothetical protein [Streptomyces sp. NRRL S-495]|uniref:hypothetical protein n=1 Tax=Streptomyces sp. NRRL S-495 TaxID=1609133 RepID=UPI0005F96DF9|nr:hypothetical protein [Streptomyces sp. NRRL S-495]KJY36221.1 hypothetical protein VR45_12130 [Streptomyces sp. NRRL S-495]